MPTSNDGLSLSPDGFLYYRGAKLPFKLKPEGIECFEKDPRRAALVGGQRFVIPFEILIDFIHAVNSKGLS